MIERVEKRWGFINTHDDLQKWAEEIDSFHLPRWEELPDFELYLDQMLNLVERYLQVFKLHEKDKLITSSMVHNYVKLGMMPKPQKKRYTRKHLAYLIAITILKQVLTIPEIKKGIIYQASISGIRGAYDLFCREQEDAVKIVTAHLSNSEVEALREPDPEDALLLVRQAATAAATKMTTRKILTHIP